LAFLALPPAIFAALTAISNSAFSGGYLENAGS
jgi:hypothetical protein